jgi:uncharacterized protein (DUF2249 family)/iron-sulfur cluster repair protein YtfE (RIC family)
MTTITATQAYEAMLEHHKRLGEELVRHADAVSGAVAAQRPCGAAVAGLIAYLAEEVLPHAAAEEETIYPAAVRAGLAGTVEEMIAEHVTLASASGRLAAVTGETAAATQAQQIAALFTAHAAKENDVLLPALLDGKFADLAALLEQMHGSAGHEPADDALAPSGGNQAEDPQATVVSLLLRATAGLARAGDADHACTIAASAWATLRDARPDLAARVTAALHGLARRAAESPGGPASAGPVSTGPISTGPISTGPISTGPISTGPISTGPDVSTAGPDRVLDVRDLPPAQRHETIFSSYQDLVPGAGFILVNDHDPKPLRYQFEAEHTGQFTWRYLENGPDTWRVRIGRPAAAAHGEARTDIGHTPENTPEQLELDVRQVSHAQRHRLIFTAYQALQPGMGFVLVNDHDPLPLRYQFEAQYAGEYIWEYLEAGPEVWRVQIGRAGASALPDGAVARSERRDVDST